MQDSITLIRRYYTAFNAKEWQDMLACLADDVRHHVNEGEVRVGKGAFEAFLAHMNRCYDEHLTNITVMATPDGQRAAAEFVVNGTYIATDEGLPEARGQNYVLPAGAFFDVENGLIARVTTFYNLRHWVSQVM